MVRTYHRRTVERASAAVSSGHIATIYASDPRSSRLVAPRSLGSHHLLGFSSNGQPCRCRSRSVWRSLRLIGGYGCAHCDPSGSFPPKAATSRMSDCTPIRPPPTHCGHSVPTKKKRRWIRSLPRSLLRLALPKKGEKNGARFVLVAAIAALAACSKQAAPAAKMPI